MPLSFLDILESTHRHSLNRGPTARPLVVLRLIFRARAKHCWPAPCYPAFHPHVQGHRNHMARLSLLNSIESKCSVARRRRAGLRKLTPVLPPERRPEQPATSPSSCDQAMPWMIRAGLIGPRTMALFPGVSAAELLAQRSTRK